MTTWNDNKGNTMDLNTTVYKLEVTYDGKMYHPIVRVADNGIWDIRGHEKMRSDMGGEVYLDWLCDFWSDLHNAISTPR